MSEILDLPPARLAPEQEQLLLAVSDAFGFSSSCRRAVCRRAGACRGFSGEPIPRCLPRVLGNCRVCFDAAADLLPGRAPRAPGIADELHQQEWRIMKRMADLMEREVEEMNRHAEARAGRRSEHA